MLRALVFPRRSNRRTTKEEEEEYTEKDHHRGERCASFRVILVPLHYPRCPPAPELSDGFLNGRIRASNSDGEKVSRLRDGFVIDFPGDFRKNKKNAKPILLERKGAKKRARVCCCCCFCYCSSFCARMSDTCTHLCEYE